jgi:hypothetical protein
MYYTLCSAAIMQYSYYITHYRLYSTAIIQHSYYKVISTLHSPTHFFLMMHSEAPSTWDVRLGPGT